MTANIGMLAIVAALIATGVYLLIERSIIRMLLGLLLVGNGLNLLILTAGGPGGNPPVVGRVSEIAEGDADPLAQAVILTAIVITMGIAAFILALAYRWYTINVADAVEDDPEDTKVATRRSLADAPDRDRSDDPVTGEPGEAGDAFDKDGNPIPLDQIKNREDLESYEDLHTGRFRDTDTSDTDTSDTDTAGSGGDR